MGWLLDKLHWDWEHRLLEEYVFWTHVIINTWILTSGIAFVVLRIRRDPSSVQAQIAHSLLAGIVGGTAIIPVLAVWSLIPNAGGPFPVLLSILILAVWIPIFVAVGRINIWLARISHRV
jgi:hypothetical protein